MEVVSGANRYWLRAVEWRGGSVRWRLAGGVTGCVVEEEGYEGRELGGERCWRRW